jgi:hypothetical protein
VLLACDNGKFVSSIVWGSSLELLAFKNNTSIASLTILVYSVAFFVICRSHNKTIWVKVWLGFCGYKMDLLQDISWHVEPWKDGKG